MSKVSEKLVVFCGWGTNDVCYPELARVAPKNWQVTFASYDLLMPSANIEEFHSNVLKFLEKEGIDKFSLLGHSMGGAIALEFTHKYPERIRRLFLVDSEGVYGKESKFHIFRNILPANFQYFKKHADTALKLIARILAKPFWHRKMAHYAHYADYEAKSLNIKVETIILWGEKDCLTPLWQGKKLHELILNSKLIVFPDLNHDWILYSPERFWEAVASS